MEYEEYPYAETPWWRVVLPAGAAVLTAIVCVALLTMRPGPALTVVVGVALALHLVGVIAQALHRRREARPYDRGWLVHIFAWSWALWSGLPALHALDDEQGPVSQVLFGLTFATITTGLLWFAYRPPRPRRDADRAAVSAAERRHHDPRPGDS